MAEETRFTIAPAREDDWPWMMNAYLRTAWETLSPEQQRRAGHGKVREQTKSQALAFRAKVGQGFCALMARDARGRRAGFIWIEKGWHGFTGESRVYVLEVYVSWAFRRRGVGRQLLQSAEAWGRERGLERIALNVAARNTAARALYESLGFDVDSVRMSKALS